MSKLDQQFYEDRAMRDAARKVLMADIEHARASFSGKGLAERVTSKVGDGTKDVFYVAKHHADENRGIIALIIGALALFFSRGMIMEIFGLDPAESEDNDSSEGAFEEMPETISTPASSGDGND